jgi:hypothetical protein
VAAFKVLKRPESIQVVDRVINHYNDILGETVKFSPGAEPSNSYKKHILTKENPGFTYLGMLNRNTHMKKVKIEPNVTIAPFLASYENTSGFVLDHRQCQPTRETGYVAIQHYSKVKPKKFKRASLEFAMEFLRKMFYPYCANSTLFSWDDVMTSLNKKTSCGYPYNLSDYFKDKNKFFGLNNWKEIVELLEAKALEDPTFRVFWQVSQKYEVRPNIKLDQPIQKIRVFLAAPVDFVVLQNKYCLSFNNRFMTAFKKTFSKVGMSKFRRGWDNLIGMFGDKSKILSIDGEKFDTTISSVFTDLIVAFRQECYNPDLDQEGIRKILDFIYANIQNSYLVLENGELVIKEMGNTSGQANTIIDNTLSSLIALVYTYHRRCEELSIEPSFEHLLSVIYAAIVGDDCLVGQHPSNLNFINYACMSKFYGELGMSITEESGEFVDIQDCEFLSTKFIMSDKGIYLPLMNRNKMFSSLMLGDPNPDPRWVLMRIFAFRIECWADKEFITMLKKMENYIYQRYPLQLCGSMYVGRFDEEVKWTDVLSMRLSDKELDYLYMGYESVPGAIPNKNRREQELNGLASKLSAILNSDSY